ncbi:MAG: peptidoglycan DD-metalloendopeptidase family protein [Candidatus Magasanikbacteria bacterium]
MTKISKFLVILFIIGVAFTTRLFVSADDTTAEIDQLNKQIETRKDKIKELEDTIAKYNNNIAQKRTEAVSLKNQMSILENRIAQAEADVSLTSAKLDKTELEIEALSISIAQKQETMDKQKKIISKIIQDLHANDQKNFLEIMLTNDNFAEFYNQAKYLEDVYTDLGRTVKQVRLIKEDLDKKKAQAEERRKTYDELLVQLENKKKDLNESMGTKQTLLVQTQSSELKYRTLLDSLRQQYKLVENEVRSYEDQVRKKLADQDRFKNIPAKPGDFVWPVSGRYVTSAFHDPDYPFRRVFEHSGTDIRSPQGSPIVASNSGYIGRAKRCTVASCYSYILLIHNGNLSTLYGHLSRITVTEDQFVTKGDIIGYSGGTPGMVGSGPFVTGAHLHFEVRLNGIPVNAENYLP